LLDRFRQSSSQTDCVLYFLQPLLQDVSVRLYFVLLAEHMLLVSLHKPLSFILRKLARVDHALVSELLARSRNFDWIEGFYA